MNWNRWLDAERANELLQRISEATAHCGAVCPVMAVLLEEVMSHPETSNRIPAGVQEWAGIS